MTWQSAPSLLTLADDEVHVWRAPLDLEPARLVPLEALLSPDERARADRYFFERDRRRFVAGRAALRQILAHYLPVAPADLCFQYSPRGKPALATMGGGDALRFNVSHSHALALYAVCRGRELGVDLEQVRPGVAEGGIAERFFAAGEVRKLRSLPAGEQEGAFFTCWTRKEAYIKAKGEGLYLSLQQFEVSLLPGERASLLRTEGDPAEAARWTLHALEPGTGYVGALAVEGEVRQICCWEWEA